MGSIWLGVRQAVERPRSGRNPWRADPRVHSIGGMRIRQFRHRSDQQLVSPGWAGECPSASGFTLPELLMVLLFVGILSAMVVPNLEIVRFRMDGAARGTMSALVSAQRQAVARQHDVVVAIDTIHRRLRIHQDRDRDGQIGPDEPLRMVPVDDGVVFGRGGAPALGGGPSVSFTETQDGLPAVRFIRNGSASEAGFIYLTSARAARSDRQPQDARAVEVDRATGRINWYYYRDHGWEQGF